MSVPITGESTPPVVTSTSTTDLVSTSTSMGPVEGESDPIDVLWSAAGVGMTDAFFSDNRLLAADEERVFVADGWGGLNETPRAAMTALSAVSGDRLWQRTDLSTVTYHTGLFIQLLTAERLVVNDQEGLLAALVPATGETIWSFDLPVGYNASGAAALGDVMYVGVHTTGEGETSPPIAYAIDLSDGSLIWQTPLGGGTDLQPIAPALSDDSVLFSTTLSHPGSAEGNLIHALNTEDGSVLWDLNLGGEQQFKFFPILVHGDIAIVPGWEETLGISIDEGKTLWTAPSVQPLMQTGDGRALTRTNHGIAEIDWQTGRTSLLASVDWSTGIYRPNGGLVVNDQLVISDGLTLHAYSVTSGESLWSWPAAPGTIVDNHVAVGEAIVVPVGEQDAQQPDDRRVVVIDPP